MWILCFELCESIWNHSQRPNSGLVIGARLLYFLVSQKWLAKEGLLVHGSHLYWPEPWEYASTGQCDGLALQAGHEETWRRECWLAALSPPLPKFVFHIWHLNMKVVNLALCLRTIKIFKLFASGILFLKIFSKSIVLNMGKVVCMMIFLKFYF